MPTWKQKAVQQCCSQTASVAPFSHKHCRLPRMQSAHDSTHLGHCSLVLKAQILCKWSPCSTALAWLILLFMWKHGIQPAKHAAQDDVLLLTYKHDANICQHLGVELNHCFTHSEIHINHLTNQRILRLLIVPSQHCHQLSTAMPNHTNMHGVAAFMIVCMHQEHLFQNPVTMCGETCCSAIMHLGLRA